MDCFRDLKMLAIPEPWNTCQKNLQIRCGPSPRERSMLWSTKLKGVGDLKSDLASDMEMQSLEFAKLVSVMLLSSISLLCFFPSLLKW